MITLKDIMKQFEQNNTDNKEIEAIESYLKALEEIQDINALKEAHKSLYLKSLTLSKKMEIICSIIIK